MSVWDDRENAETHRQPVPVEVVTEDRGYPLSILVEAGELYISDVVDLWTIQDRWWTEQSTNCDYFKVVDLGAKLTFILCHDLDRAEWYIHLARLCTFKWDDKRCQSSVEEKWGDFNHLVFLVDH